MVETDAELRARLNRLLPHLDERQQRLFLATEAICLGHGGVARVARATGFGATTLFKGIRELDEPPLPAGYARRGGGGRKRVEVSDPELLTTLERLVDPETRGDPMSPLKWTCKSTRKLSSELKKLGHQVSHDVVAQLLHYLGYSLQANVKVKEGNQHPDRDAQFRYINAAAKNNLAKGLPVISVDSKKKELVGSYKAVGREWEPAESPVAVNVHDFPDPKVGKGIPYGVYDMRRNEGWVSVGKDHDTAAFAVETIRRWWNRVGKPAYPKADGLLICADGGGSNGSRSRLWKTELAKWAEETGLTVTVCHLPPATSKWNKIEHRLFSHISMNWRGRPLETHQVMVDLIGATTTATGLTVKAELDANLYPTKIKVSDREFKAIPLKAHAFHGEWNYTLHPSKKRRPPKTMAK